MFFFGGGISIWDVGMWRFFIELGFGFLGIIKVIVFREGGRGYSSGIGFGIIECNSDLGLRGWV